jgi:hypothetical protein
MNKVDAMLKSKNKMAIRKDEYCNEIIYDGVMCRKYYPNSRCLKAVLNPDKYEGFNDWNPCEEADK